ncbi:MAG: NAD(P)/FAD-dependent oxidoreductase [Rhizobiales bacterium]|nr:NAD(P)/FAD-dependent oxidoreductase [Hyphomicrobiales bacterium]
MKQHDCDVAIVGAGFAGMHLIYRLRQLGFSVRCFDKASGVGGTWYWNRYPGARCDIESVQYSYQFDDALQQDWNWTERYATQPEILKYANHVADRFDLQRDITFDCGIASAHYDEAGQCWGLRDATGCLARARYCIMATGCLSVPNRPEIKGLERFAGPVYHTGTWPHERIDFTGLRVAVIGTGSSAIQSIPHIARKAAGLTVFQRTANYAIPAHNGPLDPERLKTIKAGYGDMRARAKTTYGGIDAVYNTEPALEATPAEREAEYERRWQAGGLTFLGAYGDLMLSKQANDTAADFVRAKIRQTVKDPAVADRLCPANIIGGKRLCVDIGYFETYNLDHVSLIDLNQHPIEEITETAIRAGGKDIAIDCLVIATGFDAMTGALMNIDIRGRGEALLQNKWANGPIAYLGLAIAGFPNLFTVTGPGSPSVLTNMLPTIEQHVEWICACLAAMRERGHTVVEADGKAEAAWTDHVRDISAPALKSTTGSWYLGSNVPGKPAVFMPYLGGLPAYIEKCQDVVANGYEGFSFSAG